MKRSIHDIQEWQGKRVLVRVDFNVPLDDKTGEITDDTRIREGLSTLGYLLEQGAKVIVMSHLGRPKGVTETLRLAPIAKHLQKLLPDTKIHYLPNSITDTVSPSVKQELDAVGNGELALLENLRFSPLEEANDPEFSKLLASLGEIYVNDAFGAAHRAHASTEGIAAFLPVKVAGLLMEREIDVLSSILEWPEHPFVAVIGGSKISTKITVLENLLKKVNTLVIGGGMVFTFLAAQGSSVGDSMMEAEYLDTARNLLAHAKAFGKKIVLAKDVVVADRFASDADHKVVAADKIPDGWMGLDIGPETLSEIQTILKSAKTVLWNGPLGVFEFDAFSAGTRQVAETLASQTDAQSCKTVLGGGDTVAALEAFKIDPKRYTHVSTGGGASLEFLEGKVLPGIAVLDDEAPVPVMV